MNLRRLHRGLEYGLFEARLGDPLVRVRVSWVGGETDANAYGLNLTQGPPLTVPMLRFDETDQAGLGVGGGCEIRVVWCQESGGY